MELSQVNPALFIGSLAAASNEELLRQHGIQTVLSLGCDLELKPPYRYKALPHVVDDPSELIIQFFPECIDFIAQGVAQGPTLVHCFAGVSRSTTVVLAFLMQSQSLSAEAARELLVSKHPITRPNDGFWEQLKLFERMECKLDLSNHAYKRLRLLQRRERDEPLDSSYFAADPIDAASLRGSVRCKMCRRVLALPDSIIDHSPGEGVRDFSNQGYGSAQPRAASCTSVFVEPNAWMKLDDATDSVQGKIKCPKCDAKLGMYNWAGMQCSCGSWQAPAFMLHKKSVDVVGGVLR